MNGHNDICQKIIKMKYNIEFEDIKKEYIEKDFYNWLNHDLLIRSKYKTSLSIYNKEYYEKNYKILGINPYEKNNYKSLRRVKSLFECFQTRWWKMCIM